MAITTKRWAFHGDEKYSALGNACLLVQHEQAISLDTLPLEHSQTTQCHTWPLADKSGYQVLCFQAGYEIACCGHGLLSCAAHWLDSSGRKAVDLHMGNSSVHATRSNTHYRLRFARQATRLHPVPDWTNAVFPGNSVTRSAIAGDDGGYLLLEWPEDYPLETLSSPGDLLQQYTQRALICLARQSSTPDFIHFRYFAPQYGIAEDMATGSAMRILVNYIGAKQLIALQVSSNKGLLFGQLHDDSIEIGGFCQEEQQGKNRQNAIHRESIRHASAQ